MTTAPRDGRYIAVKAKQNHGLMYLFVVRWMSEESGSHATGWWLPEGAIFRSEDFLGWAAIPIEYDD